MKTVISVMSPFSFFRMPDFDGGAPSSSGGKAVIADKGYYSQYSKHQNKYQHKTGYYIDNIDK